MVPGGGAFATFPTTLFVTTRVYWQLSRSSHAPCSIRSWHQKRTKKVWIAVVMLEKTFEMKVASIKLVIGGSASHLASCG